MTVLPEQSGEVGEAIGSALVTLGLRNNTERVDRGPGAPAATRDVLLAVESALPGTDDMEVYVRFQVPSKGGRWPMAG